MSATTTPLPDDRPQAASTPQRKTYHWFSNPVPASRTTVSPVPTRGSFQGVCGGLACGIGAASSTSGRAARALAICTVSASSGKCRVMNRCRSAESVSDAVASALRSVASERRKVGSACCSWCCASSWLSPERSAPASLAICDGDAPERVLTTAAPTPARSFTSTVPGSQDPAGGTPPAAPSPGKRGLPASDGFASSWGALCAGSLDLESDIPCPPLSGVTVVAATLVAAEGASTARQLRRRV